MIDQVLTDEEQIAKKFYTLSNTQTSWYFECLVITYDVSHTKRSQFLQAHPFWGRDLALGKYNIWLVEQESKHQSLMKWIYQMQEKYSQIVKVHLQDVSDNPRNFSFYRSMSSVQALNEMLLHMKHSGYLQLLQETYENQQNYDIENGASCFISLVVKESKLHRLATTMFENQKQLEQELKKSRENQSEGTPPSFILWISDSEDFDFDSESEDDEQSDRNLEIISSLKQRPPFTQNSCELKQTCGICLNNFEVGFQLNSQEEDKTLNLRVCEHLFHTHCIKQWLVKRCECPLCKRQIN